MEKAFLLPYMGDTDQHYETPNYIRTLGQYELNQTNKTIEIHDPVWGNHRIGEWTGDEIFADLYLNPLVQRSAGIEQLTLPRHFSTMPNTTDFNRWEHIWGSIVFTRKMIDKSRREGANISDRDALVMQLRTFVSDLGHTAFSHLGDWLFQGFGGGEDQHDRELMEVLEAGGVNKILRDYNISPEEVVFPDVEDWIECPSPDLCVDRVDYGVREISRWVQGYKPAEEWLEMFSVNKNGMIVMPNKATALSFATSFGLLATEHWAHPVHRLQLELFGELIKGAVTDYENRSLITDDIHNPRDILYLVDSTLNGSTRGVGELNHMLFGAMLDIARAQRKIYAHGRYRDIENFLSSVVWHEGYSTDGKQISFPDPLRSYTWPSEYTGVKPANLQLIPANNPREVTDFDTLPYTLDKFLKPLKPRTVDPLFYDSDGNVKRLSEEDKIWRRLMTEQKSLQARGYVSRLYADPEWIAELKSRMDKTSEEWERQMMSKRVSSERLGRLISDEAMMAVGRTATIHLTY